jgi:hypothetical protein
MKARYVQGHIVSSTKVIVEVYVIVAMMCKSQV